MGRSQLTRRLLEVAVGPLRAVRQDDGEPTTRTHEPERSVRRASGYVHGTRVVLSLQAVAGDADVGSQKLEQRASDFQKHAILWEHETGCDVTFALKRGSGWAYTHPGPSLMVTSDVATHGCIVSTQHVLETQDIESRAADRV